MKFELDIEDEEVKNLLKRAVRQVMSEQAMTRKDLLQKLVTTSLEKHINEIVREVVDDEMKAGVKQIVMENMTKVMQQSLSYELWKNGPGRV